MDTFATSTYSIILNNSSDATSFLHHQHGHDDILDVNEEFKHELLEYTAFQILFCILGVCGNSFIIYVYRNKLHKKREGRFFIIFLAVVDLLHCTISSALVFVKNLYPLIFPDRWSCKFLIYGTNWLFILSLLVLLLICVERYCKVCRPLSSQFTQRKKIVTSFLIVFFTGLIPVPRLIYFELREIHLGNLTGNVCGANMELTGASIVIPGILYFNFILSGAVILALMILYGFVGKAIYRQKKRKKESFSLASYEGCSMDDYPELSTGICQDYKCSCEKNNCSCVRLRIINRATIMFMIVTLVTVLSYIPLWIFVFLDVSEPKRWFVIPDSEFHFFLFLRALSVVSYLSNPVIYAYYDRKFRKVCINIFCACCSL